MTWAAVAIGGSAVIGAVASGDASRRGANTAADAARMQQQQYQQTRTDLQPWMQSGQMALSGLNQYAGLQSGGGFDPNAPGMKAFGLSDFQASPAYQFNLQQGQQAIDKSANARGNFYAPQTLQDISKFSQGTASNEFNNAYNMYGQNQQNVWNRLYALSGTGQSAANQTGTFGAAAANNQGNFALTGAGASAAGSMALGGNINQGIGNAYNQYLYNQMLQENPTYGGGGQPGGPSSGFWGER